MMTPYIDEPDVSKGKPLILQLDIAGNPRRWINFETAAYYYAKNMVAWTIGVDGYTIWGGTSHISGSRSFMDLATIIAVHGKLGDTNIYRTPTLSNRALFRRDQNTCAYCGMTFTPMHLTRDHVMPTSRGGRDKWENVVTSCGGCNRVKDDQTPEEAGMKLLYVPYAPNKHEYLILMNRRILADQMAFLFKGIPTHSRLHKKQENV